MSFASAESTAEVRPTEILPHAEVVFINELFGQIGSVGKYIRVTGIVEFYDAATNMARLADKDEFIIVDMGLCSNTVTIGSMFQIFGEIFPAGARVSLCDELILSLHIIFLCLHYYNRYFQVSIKCHFI